MRSAATSYSEQFAYTEGLVAGSLLIVATAVDNDGRKATPDTVTATVVTN